MFTKILSTFMLFVSLVGVAIAGKEDWVGTFNFLDSSGREQVALHTPKYIRIAFIQSKTFTFSKGTRLNSIVARADGQLSVDQRVEPFQAQLGKLGKVVGREIEYGPTYQE